MREKSDEIFRFIEIVNSLDPREFDEAQTKYSYLLGG